MTYSCIFDIIFPGGAPRRQNTTRLLLFRRRSAPPCIPPVRHGAPQKFRCHSVHPCHCGPVLFWGLTFGCCPNDPPRHETTRFCLDDAAPGAIAPGPGLQDMGPAHAVVPCGPALLWCSPGPKTYFLWCADQHSHCVAFRELNPRAFGSIW